jgi:uncharacterized membrane protein
MDPSFGAAEWFVQATAEFLPLPVRRVDQTLQQLQLMPDTRSNGLAPPAQTNIETVARLEQEATESRSQLERIGDAIAGFAGSMPFFVVHVLLFIAWASINTGRVPGIPAFDPYPYVFLTMLVSMESVLLSTFILMKQNRMTRRADRRSHLDLQISLLAEKEITKVLQLQEKMCGHFGIAEAQRDQEVQELSRETAVDRLASELEKKLPNE